MDKPLYESLLMDDSYIKLTSVYDKRTTGTILSFKPSEIHEVLNHKDQLRKRLKVDDSCTIEGITLVTGSSVSTDYDSVKWINFDTLIHVLSSLELFIDMLTTPRKVNYEGDTNDLFNTYSELKSKYGYGTFVLTGDPTSKKFIILEDSMILRDKNSSLYICFMNNDNNELSGKYITYTLFNNQWGN